MVEVDVAPSKIIVAVSSCTSDDGVLTLCEHDRHAAKQALWLADRVGASVELVHVVDFLDRRLSSEVEELFQLVSSVLTPELEALAAVAPSVEVTTSFQRGLPWVELMRRARTQQADLLVLSPKRQLALGERIMFGRTTWRMIRHAACPVWVVHPHGPERITNVMALVDRSDVSQRVVDATAMLALASKGQRHLLNCLDYPDDIALHRLPGARRAVAAHHDEQREAAKRHFGPLSNSGEWQIHLRDDWIVRAAPEVVEKHRIDTVVLAAVSQPRLAGILLGTTAEKLVERLAASCWIVRAEGLAWPSDGDA
jgi:nucleotide-binding universal stress UspA family protein